MISEFISSQFFLNPAAVVLTSVSVVCCHFCIVCLWVGGWVVGGRAGLRGCMMFDSMLTGLTAVAKHDWPNALIFNVPTLSPLVFGHGTSTHACTATVEAEEARGTHPSAPPPLSVRPSLPFSLKLFLYLFVTLCVRMHLCRPYCVTNRSESMLRLFSVAKVVTFLRPNG